MDLWRGRKLITRHANKHGDLRFPLLFFKFVLLGFCFLRASCGNGRLFPPSARLAVVIDVGSTGTRSHLFKWRYAAEACNNTGGVQLVLPDVNEKLRLGLTAFLDTQAQLRSVQTNQSAVPCHIVDDEKYLPCPGLADDVARYFQLVKQYIDRLVVSSQRASTPVFVFGTAGIRSLNDLQQNVLLRVIRESLLSSWQDYKLRPEWVTVIEGYREGLYSWITLQQLLGRSVGANHENMIFKSLDFERPFVSFQNTTSTLKPAMLIELGGASAQVVVELQECAADRIDNRRNLITNATTLSGFNNATAVTLLSTKKNTLQLHFCGRKTSVYAQSFEGYGRQLAFQRFLAAHALNTEQKQLQRNPCLPVDAFFPYYQFRSYAAIEDIGFPVSNVALNATEMASGVFGSHQRSFSACEQIVRSILFARSAQQNKGAAAASPNDMCPASVASPWSPLPFATDSVVEVFGNENLYFFHQLVATPEANTSRFSIRWFRDRARQLCEAASLHDIVAQIDSAAEPEKVRTGCFGLTYMAEFLEQLMKPTEHREFHAVRSINKMDIGWSSGFLLLELPWIIRSSFEDWSTNDQKIDHDEL